MEPVSLRNGVVQNLGKVEIRKKDVRIHNFRDGAVIRGDTVWEANFLSIFPLQPNGKKVEKTPVS